MVLPQYPSTNAGILLVAHVRCPCVGERVSHAIGRDGLHDANASRQRKEKVGFAEEARVVPPCQKLRPDELEHNDADVHPARGVLRRDTGERGEGLGC